MNNDAPPVRPVPHGPLHGEPAWTGEHPPAAQRAAEIRHALRGIQLGPYDDRIVMWAARFLSDTTVRALLSWLERARAAGRNEKPVRATEPGS